jgi:tRNA A-37 threonylcarbamoyl transferase component Bud32
MRIGVAVDKRYELYCLADPLFYDSPNVSASARRSFAVAGRPLPSGWTRARLGEWLVHIPPGNPIPAQGWKIHVSATRENAETSLTTLFDYCVPRGISFKFLRGPLALHTRNAKYAPRGASGKLATVYPVDDSSCERILADLDELIGGEQGPYILSDLRYAGGPLYVRYGAFKELHCRDAGGGLVPALRDPSGRLVPDLRTPVFQVPGWITVPGFLAPHLAARAAVTVNDLPCQVDKALHFSNGGGVYLGTDTRTGARVVLKEARPYAGLAADGSDAVARLKREHDILRRLSGLDAVPGVRGYFEAGDHHFLVQDYIDGDALNSLYAYRHPLIGATPDPRAIADYASWALGICDGVQRAVEAVHERGVVINDLHMFNIMVRPDDSVVLIDFEAAARLDEGLRPTLGNPGFLAPRDRTGFDIDRYSLACVKLAMFLPLTTVFALDRGKAAHVAEVIGEHFPVPPGFLDEAVRDIAGPRHRTPGPPAASRPAASRPAASRPAASGAAPAIRITPDEEGWEQARAAMVRAIQASATPSREDRLFPGDIEQFATPSGGLCLANGAAGVLHALAEAGAGCLPEHADWLLRRTASPVAGARLGLYDGMTGVAWALNRLGHPGAAQRVAETCLAERWEQLGTDLYGGLSGMALALLDLSDATGEPRLREAALRAADIVADRTSAQASSADGRPAGLLHGCSGPGLLFIRMFERTGNPGYLDLAAAMLDADLDRCVLNAKGALEVDEGWRLMPYLDGGSVGIGLVIDDFRRHRRVARFEQAAESIVTAACSTYYAQSGLFRGRAGMVLHLARCHAVADAARDPRVTANIRRLAWHAVSYQGGIAFPGDTLFRLSMDLATGTAGVLLCLATALSPGRGALPGHTAAEREDAGLPRADGGTRLPGHPVQGPEKEPAPTRR